MIKRIIRPGLLSRRAARHAVDQLHFGQGARQADRDQPQRHHPPGSAGPAAARRRAADQPEPAGLPATQEAMKSSAIHRGIRAGCACCRADPRCRRRAGGRHHRRALRWICRRARGGVGSGAQPGRVGSISSAARSIRCWHRARAPARRMSASPPAASCSRGSVPAKPICWPTASGIAARQASRRCPITAAELRTSCGIPPAIPRSAVE